MLTLEPVIAVAINRARVLLMNVDLQWTANERACVGGSGGRWQFQPIIHDMFIHMPIVQIILMVLMLNGLVAISWTVDMRMVIMHAMFVHKFRPDGWLESSTGWMCLVRSAQARCTLEEKEAYAHL